MKVTPLKKADKEKVFGGNAALNQFKEAIGKAKEIVKKLNPPRNNCCQIYSCWHPVNIKDTTPYEMSKVDVANKNDCGKYCSSLEMCCDTKYHEGTKCGSVAN